MATAKGSKSQLVIYEESVWGTTPTSPAGYKLPVSDIGLGFKRNLLDNPELTGNRNASKPVEGNVSVQGTFVSTLHLDAIGWLLKHAFGAPATSGTGPYTHVFKGGGSLPVGAEFEVGYTDISEYEVHKGCRIQNIKFSASPEGVSKIEASVVGRETAPLSATPLDATPTEYSSSVLSEFKASIEEGGSALGIASAVDITFENGLDTSMYAIGGQGLLAELPEGAATVSGSVTAFFQDETLYNKAINGTETSLKLTWADGTDSLEILIPELVYSPASPKISGPAGIKLTLSFKGYYQDSAEAAVIQATLINSVSSY